jgi:hypothetical protein
MSTINVTDGYVAEGTYGIGGQVVYRNGTELAAIVNIDLKNERNELKKGGSGRTYDLSSTVGVTIELESWSVYRENYVKFLGYQNRPTTDTQNREVPGYAVTGKDVAPEVGFMFIVDNHQEAARAAFNLPYTLERKWSVIHVFKATIHEEGLNASTHISGESPSYNDTKLIIKGEMLNTEGQDIYSRHWFASEEEARLYILKTMRVQMNVQFEVDPDAEDEEDRIVNIPLIGGIRYGLEELTDYLRDHVMGNQVVRELLIQGVEGAVNYVIPGSSLVLGRIIRPLFNIELDDEDNPQDNPQGGNNGN